MSLCENFQWQNCSYIIPLSNGPWMDCGRRPIYLKFALKVTHPCIKSRFRQISLNSAAAVTASEKSWIIAKRKWTTRFPSSHRWTPCVTPKSSKGWLKTRIFTFGVAFHFFVAGNRSDETLQLWYVGWTYQVPAYGRQIVPERGVVTVTRPL